MGAVYARQPNGLICRFSSIVDDITDYNMTDSGFVESYIQDAIEKAKQEAELILKYRIRPFSEIEDLMALGKSTKDNYNKLLVEMSKPLEELLDEQASVHDKS